MLDFFFLDSMHISFAGSPILYDPFPEQTLFSSYYLRHTGLGGAKPGNVDQTVTTLQPSNSITIDSVGLYPSRPMSFDTLRRSPLQEGLAQDARSLRALILRLLLRPCWPCCWLQAWRRHHRFLFIFAVLTSLIASTYLLAKTTTNQVTIAPALETYPSESFASAKGL